MERSDLLKQHLIGVPVRERSALIRLLGHSALYSITPQQVPSVPEEERCGVAVANGVGMSQPTKQQQRRIVTLHKAPHEGLGMSITVSIRSFITNAILNFC